MRSSVQKLLIVWVLTLSATFAALGQNDLSLSVTTTSGTVSVGDSGIDFTITVNNEGATTVTNVQVATNLPSGLSLTGNTPSVGTYDTNLNIWNIGTISSATSSVTLTLTFDVTGEGVQTVQGFISGMTEVDGDSDPNDNSLLEDDYGAACVTAPFEYCAGQTISIDASAPLGHNSYQWYKNNVAIPGATNQTYTITEAGNFRYEVNVGASGTCAGGSCCDIIVIENTPPTAGITNNTGTTELTCTTTSISLTATGGGTYLWSDTGSTTTADLTVTSAGTYTVTVTAANGCTATSQVVITQDITPPTAGITNNTGSTEITCLQTSISLTATGGGTYLWSDTGSTTTADLTVTSAGTYTVTVTAANGCTATSQITITGSCTVDYADLPDGTAGNGPGDYNTTSANNGPSHGIVTGLVLGSNIDAESDGQPSANGDGDDTDGTDDDDGMSIGSTFDIVPGGTIRIPYTGNNSTGSDANLVAWVDWNNDGVFSAGEKVTPIVVPGTGAFSGHLTVPVPETATTGSNIGLLVRLSNSAITSPDGYLTSGEVESYMLSVNCPTQICIPATSIKN